MGISTSYSYSKSIRQSNQLCENMFKQEIVQSEQFHMTQTTQSNLEMIIAKLQN